MLGEEGNVAVCVCLCVCMCVRSVIVICHLVQIVSCHISSNQTRSSGIFQIQQCLFMIMNKFVRLYNAHSQF